MRGGFCVRRLRTRRRKLRCALLKEIRLLLDPEDDEDGEDPTNHEDDADEKEIALALRGMVRELTAIRL
jgi:hypothetical protein